MKTMIKTLSALTAFLFAFNTQAQIPTGGTWPTGVTLTDLDGNTHDLDALLNAGKTVFIDAFADWCGPCWTYHQYHDFENLHTQYGASGTDEIRVFGVEADANTAASSVSAPDGQGDWTDGVSYPMVNDHNIASIINLSYYPTIIMICPDRSVTEVGQKQDDLLYADT